MKQPGVSNIGSKIDDFFYIIDRDHRFTYVNPALLGLWKKTLAEVVGKNFAELGYPADLVVLHTQQLNRVLAGEIVHGENAFTDVTGVTQFYEYTFVPVMNTESQVTAICGSTRNVTARTEIAQRLQESEDSFRTFAEAMPQMAFVSDPLGNIIYYNRPWYDFVRIEGTEGEGWKTLPIHHPDDLEPTIARWKNSIDTGVPYEMEYRLRRFDGEYIWHLGRALPVRDSTGAILKWIGTNTDIHRHKKSQENNLSLMSEREKMVQGLSHDLRSPLTVAKLKAQLTGRLSDDPRIQQLSADISRNIDRVDRMINDILDAGKIEAGVPVVLRITNFGLRKLVSSVLEEYTSVYGDRFQIQADEIPDGHWDEHALKRVIENLLSNAVKYGADQTPIKITVALLDERLLSLSVHNFGNPIPSQELPSLFDIYQRSALTQQKVGWGLGLALVKGLTAAHGGTVHVESSKALGTTFTVFIPLDARPGQLIPEAAEE